MTDYNAYRAEKGISRGDMIRAVKLHYPKYSKVTQSFVDNPANTGVCLLPEAEYHLVDIYGFGRGLSIVDDGTYQPAHRDPPAKKQPNRRKGHRHTVRLGDEKNARVLEFAARHGFATMQDLIETALDFYLQAMWEDC